MRHNTKWEACRTVQGSRAGQTQTRTPVRCQKEPCWTIQAAEFQTDASRAGWRCSRSFAATSRFHQLGWESGTQRRQSVGPPHGATEVALFLLMAMNDDDEVPPLPPPANPSHSENSPLLVKTGGHWWQVSPQTPPGSADTPVQTCTPHTRCSSKDSAGALLCCSGLKEPCSCARTPCLRGAAASDPRP